MTVLLGTFFAWLPVCLAQDSAPAGMPAIPSLREQARVRDAWLLERLETLVPPLLRSAGIDLWVLVGREYDSDPVLLTMLPATWMTARRRTILVFHDPGADQELERLCVARYDLAPFFTKAWDGGTDAEQWARLADIVAARDPQRIGISVSPTFGHADGLAKSQADALEAALDPRYRARLVSAEQLSVGWLQTRTPAELERYPELCRVAHAIIAEGFSAAVVKPGSTTTKDLEWWYRERIRALGLTTWFHPTVSLQRAEQTGHSGSFAAKPGEERIERGDLLHVDFGITCFGLNTDTQQHAYVLKQGESAAPQGLRDALAVGNRLQDLLTSAFERGRSGNEVLAAALAKARSTGIEAVIYTHPLGLHGHGAGPPIGLWDQQGGVIGSGEWPLVPNTVWAIELNARVSVPEWNDQQIRVMLEEDAWFDGEKVEYLDGRQTNLIVIAP